MADPQNTLAPRFDAAIIRAFGEDHRGTDPLLRRSDRADYQANCAMGLGKKLRKSPRDVATALVAALDVADVCSRVEIAGPGFINLTLSDAYLTRATLALAADERLGLELPRVKETVVIDYSGPNVAKEMHVGHLRSTILGDALARIFEALGHHVVRQNHLGDWGTPFGMLIEHLLDQKTTGHDLSVTDLNAFYREARAKFDASTDFAERSRLRVVALQSGDAETLALWKRLVDESRRHFAAIYARLGVTLGDKDIRGESFYNPMLSEIAAELEQKGLGRIDQGALCVFPPGFSGREGEPLPLLVRKQDGGYGYGATDLAAIRYRAGVLAGTRLLYVVGAPQSQHLSMVFASARLAGFLPPEVRAEHVAFGSILGADKKPYKTRSGETVKLVDLLDEAIERAAAVVATKNPDLDEEARKNVARMVGFGAVKYADLSSDRIKDYIFDWDRMLAFEGNTAPYLQYAHARIRSIVRRASGAVSEPSAIHLRKSEERALALELLHFGSAVSAVAESLEPHRLCTYLFGLAGAFTSFYEKCPVLKAESEEERRSRLGLCELSARVLERGLGLLGIEAPERM